MTSQHDFGYRITFLYFLFLFFLHSTATAIPLGRPPVGSTTHQHLSNAESRQVIVSTSNIATSSPYLSRSHPVRDVSSLDATPSTSALPTLSNVDNQHDTKNDSTDENQLNIAISIAAAAGCMCILPFLLLTLYRLYKRVRLARPQANALEVFSLVSEWRLDTFRSNDMRIDPFTPVSETTTTHFDSMGQPDFRPLPPVIRISRHSCSSVDTQSPFSSPTSPCLYDRKPRPPPLAVIPVSSSVPRPTRVQAVTGVSGENELLNVSASLLSTSVLPKTPPPIYSETTPSNHIALTAPPVLSNRRAK